jgi:hypothetical protein
MTVSLAKDCCFLAEIREFFKVRKHPVAYGEAFAETFREGKNGRP